MTEDHSPQLPDWTNQEIALATLLIVAVGLGFWLLSRFYMVLFIFFVAVVLGTAIRPAVEWLYRRGLTRAGGVFVIYLGLLILAAGMAWMIVPLLIEQGQAISAEIPNYYQKLRELVLNSPLRLIRQLGTQLPGQLDLSAGILPPGSALSRVGQAFGYTGLLLRGFLATLSVFLLGFYWTLESERTVRFLLLLAPAERRESARDLLIMIETRLGAFIRGEILLMLAVGGVSLIVYLLIGLPYPLVLALFAGLMEAIPNIGPALGAIPALFIALSSAPEKILWVIAATALIQFAENNWLVPRIMGRAVGVNPVVTLLALATFASFFGLPGALLAVPSAAIIQLLIDRFVLMPATEVVSPPAGRDALSRLHYEVQDLVSDIRKQLRGKEPPADPEVDRLEDMLETLAEELGHLLTQLEPQESEESSR